MARGTDSPTAPRALRREATKQALLDAAHRLAKVAGADCLDPAQVAEAAGVSRPLFYAHFPTRAAFVDALLTSIHERSGPPAPPAADTSSADPRAAVLSFFGGLAVALDRHSALARAIVPASHLPGPVAEVRARRRERAIAAVADRLPRDLHDRAARAAFLMDAFLGIQLAWSKGQGAEEFASRVRRDLAFALDGVLGSRAPRAPRSAARLRAHPASVSPRFPSSPRTHRRPS